MQTARKPSIIAADKQAPITSGGGSAGSGKPPLAPATPTISISDSSNTGNQRPSVTGKPNSPPTSDSIMSTATASGGEEPVVQPSMGSVDDEDPKAAINGVIEPPADTEEEKARKKEEQELADLERRKENLPLGYEEIRRALGEIGMSSNSAGKFLFIFIKRYNRLTTLRGIEPLTRLETLRCSHNQLISLDGIVSPTKASLSERPHSSLSARSEGHTDSISTNASGTGGHVWLRQLDISYNRLDRVDHFAQKLSGLPMLVDVVVRGNPFVTVSDLEAIASNGVDEAEASAAATAAEQDNDPAKAPKASAGGSKISRHSPGTLGKRPHQHQRMIGAASTDAVVMASSRPQPPSPTRGLGGTGAPGGGIARARSAGARSASASCVTAGGKSGIYGISGAGGGDGKGVGRSNAGAAGGGCDGTIRSYGVEHTRKWASGGIEMTMAGRGGAGKHTSIPWNNRVEKAETEEEENGIPASVAAEATARVREDWDKMMRPRASVGSTPSSATARSGSGRRSVCAGDGAKNYGSSRTPPVGGRPSSAWSWTSATSASSAAVTETMDPHVRLFSPSRLLLLYRLPRLTILDSLPVTCEEKVAALNRHSPPSFVTASLDHAKLIQRQIRQYAKIKAVDLVRAHRLRPLVMCGPNGVGKRTLTRRLLAEFPHIYGCAVSHTTREPRPGEEDGVNYWFVKGGRAEMEMRVEKGEFLEVVDLFGVMYGTSLEAIDKVTEEGKVCIMDLEIEGVLALKRSHLKPYYIFITVPSLDVLQQRLEARMLKSANAANIHAPPFLGAENENPDSDDEEYAAAVVERQKKAATAAAAYKSSIHADVRQWMAKAGEVSEELRAYLEDKGEGGSNFFDLEILNDDIDKAYNQLREFCLAKYWESYSEED
ncbi:hypothetical protein HDU96_001874 [Phlyctochytrium bullatum]|nr:hypothetical protein HDU96_001874 [Phlyctochytrium bullatum]